MHRTITKQGLEIIKRLEGFKSEQYICSGGFLTIGYGHKILPSDKFYSINKEKAEELLKNDLLKFERAVIKNINTSLDNNQFDALVSFTYNVGAAALQRSVLRQKINYGLYEEGAKEFVKWIYAGGKKISGLVYRRKIESQLFLSKLALAM